MAFLAPPTTPSYVYASTPSHSSHRHRHHSSASLYPPTQFYPPPASVSTSALPDYGMYGQTGYPQQNYPYVPMPAPMFPGAQNQQYLQVYPAQPQPLNPWPSVQYGNAGYPAPGPQMYPPQVAPQGYPGNQPTIIVTKSGGHHHHGRHRHRRHSRH